MTLKTYLITSQLDSAQIVIQQIHDFIERQHSSSQMADLESECFNMKGNIFARVGNMDSAEICFRKAYELRMRGTRIEVVPDILMNYNPQIQISAESETKRSIFREKDKTKRSKKESAQHSKSRNKSFVMTSVSAL